MLALWMSLKQVAMSCVCVCVSSHLTLALIEVVFVADNYRRRALSSVAPQHVLNLFNARRQKLFAIFHRVDKDPSIQIANTSLENVGSSVYSTRVCGRIMSAAEQLTCHLAANPPPTVMFLGCHQSGITQSPACTGWWTAGRESQHKCHRCTGALACYPKCP